MSAPAVHRSFADTQLGQIHYAETGQGDPPLLMLHQTPRSWDEFREVLPLVGEHRRAIAMDTVGFGDSAEPGGEDSIEEYARGVVLLCRALELEQVVLVGHHTGGVVAIEVAATEPGLVSRLVLSATPLVDDELRAATAGGVGVDEADQHDAGLHLLELWHQRLPLYPPGRPDLLERFIVDALKAGGRMRSGHDAVSSYRMEDRLSLISAPATVIEPTDDPHAQPHAEPLARALGARVIAVEGGMVPLPDHMPREFADAVIEALQ